MPKLKNRDPMVPLNLNVEPEVKLEIEKLAKADARPAAQVGRLLLLDGLELARKRGLNTKGRRNRTNVMRQRRRRAGFRGQRTESGGVQPRIPHPPCDDDSAA